MAYAKRVAAETGTEETAYSCGPHTKKTAGNRRYPNQNRKKGRKRHEKKEEKISINTDREYTHTSGSQRLRGGGVAQRRNNRKTESATRESRETKRNARKAIQESDKKTTKRKDKTSFKQCETTRKQQSSWGKPNACTT